MKTAIIIHGYNTKEEYRDTLRTAASNDHFIPWIQRQLLLEGVEAQTPEMPGFYEPNYRAWKKMLERFGLNEETILIGHSCGGGFLVRYLSEENIKVGRVVLVAPWLDPEREIDPNFFDFKIDKNIYKKTEGIVVMYSTDDDETIIKSIDTLKHELINVNFIEFNNKGHFCLDNLGTPEFPELLEQVLKK